MDRVWICLAFLLSRVGRDQSYDEHLAPVTLAVRPFTHR